MQKYVKGSFLATPFFLSPISKLCIPLTWWVLKSSSKIKDFSTVKSHQPREKKLHSSFCYVVLCRTLCQILIIQLPIIQVWHLSFSILYHIAQQSVNKVRAVCLCQPVRHITHSLCCTHQVTLCLQYEWKFLVTVALSEK